MKLYARPYNLRLKVPFTISRGTASTVRNVLLEVRKDDLVGYGEAAPTTTAYYGETQETILAVLDDVAPVIEEADDPTELLSRLDDLQFLERNTAARSGLEMALLDLLGKEIGAPLHRLWGLPASKAALTSFTIGIDTPEQMADQARAAAACPIIKIKIGTGPEDIARVRAIREARPEARLHVNANGAWRPKQALTVIERLVPFGIEFVEQPVAGPDLAGLRFVRERSPLPIFADESCITLEDIPRVAEAADGIVVKLMKCGGPRHALAMIHAARAHRLQVMLGSMVESAVAITAAAHLTPLVDYADLDGILLLADQPFIGVSIDQGKLILPDQPGLGVHPASVST